MRGYQIFLGRETSEGTLVEKSATATGKVSTVQFETGPFHESATPSPEPESSTNHR